MNSIQSFLTLLVLTVCVWTETRDFRFSEHSSIQIDHSKVLRLGNHNISNNVENKNRVYSLDYCLLTFLYGFFLYREVPVLFQYMGPKNYRSRWVYRIDYMGLGLMSKTTQRTL